MNWDRILAITKKEIAHILRDPFTIALALGLPVFMVLVYGYAIEFNIREIATAYLDSDHTVASRSLVETFGSSNYFRMFPVTSPKEGLQAVASEKARALIIIPPGFKKGLNSERGTSIQVLVDAADNSAISSISNYLIRVLQIARVRILDVGTGQPITVQARFLFNPELNSRWFVVPGLVVVVMAILSILMTSLTVTREWENGSMELLLSTPVQPGEIIIGKLAPYAGLGIGAVTLVYVLARTLFGVPFVGSHIVFIAGCVLFLVTYLALGLLISVTVRKQMIAVQFAMLFGLLPSLLLSGFVFPIESMPTFFQYFTMLIPARWFINIARDVFLQGSSVWELKENFIWMGCIGSLLLLTAVRRFKRDLEP